MVTRSERSYRRPDLLYDAYTLVSQDSPRLTAGHVAFENVQICAADGGLDDLNDGVGGREDVRLRVLLQPLLSGPQVNQCLHCVQP